METKQTFEFDKFMDDIIIKETKEAQKIEQTEDETPQKQLVRRIRGLSSNKIRYGK